MAAVATLYGALWFPSPTRSMHHLTYSYSQFMSRFAVSVGAKGSNSFVPLRSPLAKSLFIEILEALLANRVDTARRSIEALDELGVQYELVQIAQPGEDATVLGFLERARPGTVEYRGWGALLVRAETRCSRVYQAPHVWADEHSETIAIRAFGDDPRGCAVMFAGTHRYANQGGSANSDVAHATDNLFHALTEHLARRGKTAGTPYWFIQFHGSAARVGEPTITASNGAKRPRPNNQSPLVQINDQVNRAGYLDMGVCGWPDEQGEWKNGRYLLCATSNAQGLLLGDLGLRRWFMHFEIARSARSEYIARRAPGYEGIVGLLESIRRKFD